MINCKNGGTFLEPQVHWMGEEAPALIHKDRLIPGDDHIHHPHAVVFGIATSSYIYGNPIRSNYR